VKLRAPARGGRSAPRRSILSSSKLWGRVAGVERSEPPGPRISGGSLTLDPGHPKSDHPNLELLILFPIRRGPAAVGAVLWPPLFAARPGFCGTEIGDPGRSLRQTGNLAEVPLTQIAAPGI